MIDGATFLAVLVSYFS